MFMKSLFQGFPDDQYSLRKRCPYSESFWSAFSRIRTEYREIQSISPYSVKYGKIRTRVTPNTDTFHALIRSYLYFSNESLTTYFFSYLLISFLSFLNLQLQVLSRFEIKKTFWDFRVFDFGLGQNWKFWNLRVFVF